MLPITILVGTMTGNAEFAAEDIQQVLREDYGCNAEFLLMDALGPDILRPDRFYLICTSTYGVGEVPENARQFYGALQAQRPDLTGVRYGVFGLGDSTYRETFNFGGKNFDELFTALGARRLGERAKHDAQSDVSASDYGREWARSWYQIVRGALDRPAI